MPGLKLHNTLSGKKEDFKPVDAAHVRLYACGPTVYNFAHIGNARMAVVFDLLARVLRTLYPKVTYVSNITDVDDKIIAASAETGEPIDVITQKYAAIYNEDMAALGVCSPDVQPRATEHIGDMVALIGSLIQKGHAYAADGHVLFDVPSFPAYGALSRRSREEQEAGARVEVAPYKKDPADFVLWKPSAPDQPGWDSPWGRGRPGWHIECSAMAERHLGLPFDIHGGGADLKFPHHENEIAQSCCAHGHETAPSAFAKYWVHNGFVTVEGEKMAKSLGNVTLAHDLLKEHRGETLRLALLYAQYSQPLDWSEKLLQEAKSVLDYVYRVLYEHRYTKVKKLNQKTKELILEGLLNDLNTPLAIRDLHRRAKVLRSIPSTEVVITLSEDEKEQRSQHKAAILFIGEILGILKHDPAEWLGYDHKIDLVDVLAIESLLKERQAARAAKDFARADEIRAELDAMGIVIEDTPDGPKWRRAG